MQNLVLRCVLAVSTLLVARYTGDLVPYIDLTCAIPDLDRWWFDVIFDVVAEEFGVDLSRHGGSFVRKCGCP